MKQIFFNYLEWEDYISGMYETVNIIDYEEKINNAKFLLSNENLFYETLKDVLKNWVKSSAVNLTNKQQNRRAWLGAAACMYKFNVPEILTRIAWNSLEENIQNKANLIAEKIIIEYQNNINNVKTLF
jgi:hypothetical protein